MNLNIAETVLDEIALEGLDGITLSVLWTRLSTREPIIHINLDYQCQCYIWKSIILKNKQLEFFKLPSPRQKFIHRDRFQYTEPDTGVCIEQKHLGDCYPVNIIREDCNGLKGSCSTFNTRKNITATIRLNKLDLANVEKKYGETFVIVASQKLRCIALYGRNNYETELYKIVYDDKIYCFLERIARSRHQGELTFGYGNINQAFKIKPANTFPLRKKLKKYNLITVQDFSLKQLGSSPNAAGKLLMLSRFHKDHVPLYVNYLTSISNILSMCPLERHPLTQVRESLNFSEDVFRKILRLGSKYMKVEMRPYRELYPNAEPNEYLTKGKNAERGVKVLKLVAPYKGTLNDDEADEKVQDDEDDVDIDCSSTNGFGMFPEEYTFMSYLDQSTLSHCYKVIDAYGKEGLKGKELGRRMHFSVFDMRLIWKSLEKRDCIDIVKVEEGKHRFRKLCLKKNIKSSCLPRLILPCKSSKLDLSTNSSTLVNDVKDEGELTQNVSMDLLSLFDENTASLRNVTRANIILEMVNNLKIISDMQIIKQRIFDEEGNKLFSIKSLRKILQLLVSSGKINKFEKSGTIESGERKFDFYCDLSVDEESLELQRALLYRLQKERTSLLASDAKAIQETTSSENIPILKFKSTTHNKPKFAKAKVMHQFLWYLCYGSEEHTDSDHSQMDNIHIPAWKKHISPLPKLIDYPEGWCNVSDVVDNMPLSIFLDIVLSISPDDISGLEMYTKNPERIHTRLHDIPVQIVCQLSNGRKYLHKFQQVCETLVKLGVLSFGKCDQVKKEEMFMYVHTKASLTNIPECLLGSPLFSNIGEDGRILFELKSFRDVHNFWLAFQTASLDVTAEPLNVEKCKRRELKIKFYDSLRGKGVHEIIDNGKLPGDGRGPGGTDSSLFASTKRNWCQSNESSVILESFAFSGYTKKHPKIKKELSSNENNVGKITSKVDKIKSEKPVKRGSALGTKQLKKRSSKLIKRRSKKAKLESDLESEEEDDSESLTTEEKDPPAKDGRRKCYDEKDKEAQRLMTRMRVSWTPEEDRVILLCILTNFFLANDHRWIVPSTTVREILHEKMPTSRNKMSQACLRRKNYLMKKEEVRKNICVYHSEALQNKELCEEFKVGKKYSISRIRTNEAPFKACLAKLEKSFDQNASHSERTVVLPDTIEEFHKKFDTDNPYWRPKRFLKEATDVNQVDFYKIQNVVHAIALLNDKIGRAHELYDLLSHFPQNVLNPVLKYMIAVGIFTKLKRQVEHKNSVKNPSYNMGSYHLTQRYQYLFHVTYPKKIFESTFAAYSSLPPLKEDPCHGSHFLTLNDSSSSAGLMTSLMALNKIRVETVAPVEMVTIETTSEEQSPPKTRLNKKKLHIHFNEDDTDASDDSDFLDNIESKAVVNNSRTLLSWHRCQYTHSKSTKLIDLGNNLFINSCSVRIGLSSECQTQIKPSTYVSWTNSIYALDKVREWNKTNSSIHPKTCYVLLKLMRVTFPDVVDSVESLEHCIQLVGSDLSDLVAAIHENILMSTIVGRSVEELLATFEHENMETILHILKIMVALNLVIRVGVNDFKYVCFEHANNWLVPVKKNLKGRGVIYKNKCQFSFDDFQIKKTLEEVECPYENVPLSCLDVNSPHEAEEDVEVILKYANFIMKQKLPKKGTERHETQQVPERNIEKSKPSSLAPNHGNQKQTQELNGSNNISPPKTKQKPPNPKKRHSSPNPRPTKKQKNCNGELQGIQEIGETASFRNNPGGAMDSRCNETQIDFFMDQLSSSTHDHDTDYSEFHNHEKTNHDHYGCDKREDNMFASARRHKSDETLYTDFVQDPNFNFSSYLKESSAVINNNSHQFNNSEHPHIHNHCMATGHSSPMGLGMSFSSHSQVISNPNYPPLFNNWSGDGDQGYIMPHSVGIIGKDGLMHMNGGQHDGRELALYGHVGKPLQQLDGAADDDNSANEGDSHRDTSPSLRTSNRLRNNSNKSSPNFSHGPIPKGTYKIMKTLPRPWKTPESTINRTALSSMLESVCLFLLEHPGISKEAFLAKYQVVLQPVVLLEFVEILESLGVLTKTLLKKSHKPSLFSKRSVFIPTLECRGTIVETYSVTPDCIIKMGQFLNQLHANRRNSDESED